MAYDNSINIGSPPVLWSNVYDAIQQINENFTIIGSALGRTVEFNIAHIELSNPVRVVTVSDSINVSTGQQAFLNNTGISQIDGNTYYVSKISDNEYELYTDTNLSNSVDGTGFDAYASGGGTIQGLTDFANLDFESFGSNIIPSQTSQFTLGNSSNRWAEIHIADTPTDAVSNENNGLWLGNAQLKGRNGIVDLPINSTVNGELIIDPNKTFFKEVQVDNDQVIVASDFVDSLNLLSGTAIQLTVDSSAESITIDNIGVTQLAAGTGIGISSSTGNITVSNNGVVSLTNGTFSSFQTANPTDNRVAGSGVAISSSSGNVEITNTGILSVAGAFGISASTTDGNVQIQVNPGVVPTAAFTRFVVDGDLLVNTIEADGVTDTFTFDQGYGIVLTNNATTDTMTVAVDPNIDIYGSVYASDSTRLIDGIDGIIFAQHLQGTATIDVVGDVTGNTTGYHTGDVTGSVFGDDSTKLIDAVESKIVGPVENTAIATNTITGRSNLTMVGANTDTNGGTVVVVGGTGNGGDGGDITLAAGIGSAGDGGEVTIAGGIGSTDGGDIAITGGGGSGGQGGQIDIRGGSGGTDGGDITIYAGPGGPGYRNGVINIGTFTTSAVNIDNAVITGDLTGSVFGDDSTTLVDGVDNVIYAQYLQGSAIIDITGSVFGDDSTLLVNGVDGTLAYYPTTPGDWNGDAPTTVGEALDRLATLVKALNGGTGA